MSFSTWFRTPRIRRGVALATVVLATGGLVLYQAPVSGAPSPWSAPVSGNSPMVAGKHSTTFAGDGAHGIVSLSHGKLAAGQSTTMYADVRVAADASARESHRAPISLAVVLDTSGSMQGEKIDEARRAVLRLIADMRDDDEIAMVRYDDHSELMQPLARVGSVRSSLSERVRGIRATGGTNIPGGLSRGLHALDEASHGRVRRVVVVSDGLDNTRDEAVRLAENGFRSGVTVSSMGIGLDFDASYMGSVADSGHGNFAFVKDGASLSAFLQRELVETTTTTVEAAKVTLRLPPGVRFVSASGADARSDGEELTLSLGSLFSGDQRRVIVELSASGLGDGERLAIGTRASWNLVGGAPVSVDADAISLLATRDGSAVDASKDGNVLASAVSVTASRRQMQANDAYESGDVAKADALAAENERALSAAHAVAPQPALAAQLDSYRSQRKGFATAPPRSDEGRAAAKASAAKDLKNLSRSAF